MRFGLAARAGTVSGCRRFRSRHCRLRLGKPDMSALQLDPPIPVITPKGDGYAHLLIDYGPEYNLLWVCFLDDSGECWTYDNTQIRAQKNITMGRTFVSRHQPKPASVAAE